MNLRQPARALIVAVALSLGACAQVEQTMQDAAAGIGRLFGTDEADQAAPAAAAPETAETLYQEALAAQAVGDEDVAFEKFLAAAKLGHPSAAYEVSQAYTLGRGTSKDIEAGTTWTTAAADMGEPRAQFVIGAAYYGGVGVQQDYARAIDLLERAAAQDHAEAEYLLGDAYTNGRGVAQDHAWAARWYGKAAAQGLPEAQYALGLARISGLGLPPDTAAGYGWLLLAARGGYDRAVEMSRVVAVNLTPPAVNKAEAWAEAFAPQPAQEFADTPTVMYVQHTLNGMGIATGPVDGIAGPITKRAIMHYETQAGMAEDGEITPALLDRLRAEKSDSA